MAPTRKGGAVERATPGDLITLAMDVGPQLAELAAAVRTELSTLGRPTEAVV